MTPNRNCSLSLHGLLRSPTNTKVVIAGNHDIGLDKDCTYRSALARRAATYATPEETDILISTMNHENIIYLCPKNRVAELVIPQSVLRIYGRPFSPISIAPSAFMRSGFDACWSDIQHGPYDLLLSHSPPRGHLDQNRRGEHIGCDHFWSAIRRVQTIGGSIWSCT